MSVEEFCGPEYWKKRWSNSEICFHKEDVHPMLQKYLNKLTDENNNSKIFFPLCGKAVDMAWLASMGHEIVGVDLAQKAIEQFFSENKIPVTVVDSGDFRLYKSEDGRIKLYLGDFFKFNSQYEGKFECVWDRACIVALTSKIRAQYAAHIQTLLADDFKYLLDVFEFDQSLFEGPPHSVSLNELNNLYGTKCAIEQLDSFFMQNPQPLFPEQFVANPPYEKVYLLTDRGN